MRISDWSSDVCSSDLRASSPAPFDHCWSQTASATPGTPRTMVIACAICAGGRLPLKCATRRTGLASKATVTPTTLSSEEHTSELQSPMRNSYAVFFCQQKKQLTINRQNQQDQDTN